MSAYRISRLPNGLIELWDGRCLWASFYNPDGSYRGGAVNNPLYSAAVRSWIANH